MNPTQPTKVESTSRLAGNAVRRDSYESEPSKSVMLRLHDDPVIQSLLRIANPEGFKTMKGYRDNSKLNLFVDIFESIFAKNTLPIMQVIRPVPQLSPPLLQYF